MKSIYSDLRKTYFIRKETEEDGVKVYECRFKSFLVGGRHVVNNLYTLNIRAVLQIADGTEFIMERKDFERLHFFESADDALTNGNASFGSANFYINTEYFSGLREKFAKEHNGIRFSEQGEMVFYEWDEKKCESVRKVCYCAYHTDLVTEKAYMHFDFDKSKMFATKTDCDKANIGGVKVFTFADLAEREREKIADLKRKYDSFLEYAEKYVSRETISLFSMDFFYVGESNKENLKNQINGIF